VPAETSCLAVVGSVVLEDGRKLLSRAVYLVLLSLRRG
jgi:hypothetical protein